MYIYHFIDNLFQSIVMGNRYSFGQWEVIKYILRRLCFGKVDSKMIRNFSKNFNAYFPFSETIRANLTASQLFKTAV